MRKTILLYCILIVPGAAFADANNGQFMGYQLGDNYPSAPVSSEVTTSGNLLIVAEEPVKPASIAEVRLVTTPKSRTIGYIAATSWHETEEEARASGRRYAEALRTLYPDWDFGRELMDARLRIIEVNFDKAPYNLQLRLERDKHQGQDMWRFSMGLGWQADSMPWRAWQDQAANERATAQSSDADILANHPDFRGL
jgi:hypothetical protein